MCVLQLIRSELWVHPISDRLHVSSLAGRLAAHIDLLLLVPYLLFEWVENPAKRVFRGIFARMEARR